MCIFNFSLIILIYPGIEVISAFSIGDHASEIYSFIYSRPLQEDSWHPQEIKSRHKHDIVHVCRVAVYTFALLVLIANTHEKNLPTASKSLIRQAQRFLTNPEDTLLLMVSALLHDAGRQGEGSDHWDYDSGLIIFYYLTEKMGIQKDKARIFAEATANKDARTQGFYYRLSEYAPDKFRWEQAISPENLPFTNLVSVIIAMPIAWMSFELGKFFLGPN